MLALQARFLAGRYHATGWDHQVNEGTIEWPPSPWRLLRTLVAASYRLADPPDDEALSSLLTPMAESLPSYVVPPFTEGHTRHYMPIDGNETTLIFNAFVAPGSGPDEDDGALTIVWPDVTLGEAERGLLVRLCEQVGYLGRAESWAELIVLDEAAPIGRPNCVPATDAAGDPIAPVRLMAPSRRAEHLAWVAANAQGRGKKAKPIPRTLLDVLRLDSGKLRAEGWSTVPGSRWVAYSLERSRAPRTRAGTRRKTCRYALFALKGAVQPRVESTLLVGELMHKALIAWSRDEQDRPSQSLLPTPHARDAGSGHAAVCPLSSAGRDIDHVLVTARDGFDEQALFALENIRKLNGIGAYPLTLTLLGVWTDEELATIPPRTLPSIMGRARTWRSVTPFVLSRHPKLRKNGQPRLDEAGVWIDGPEAQLRLELARRGLPEPVAVRPAGTNWHRFRRQRVRGDGARGPAHGYGFEIEFAEPVQGPILLGYGRFFGLGQFAPVARGEPVESAPTSE